MLIFGIGHRPQAFFKLLIISAKLGLLPYISINDLNSFVEKDNPAMMESPNTPILVKICHAGTSDTPNLTIVCTGAVAGNIESTTQIGLFGKLTNNPENHSGINNIMT